MTAGERLRIHRRREGLTQAQAAAKLAMPLGSYKLAEDDDAPDCWDIPRPAVGRLQDHEYCFLRRRREGLTLDDLAPKVGVTKWWLCLMEKGKAPVNTLMQYWSAQ